MAQHKIIFLRGYDWIYDDEEQTVTITNLDRSASVKLAIDEVLYFLQEWQKLDLPVKFKVDLSQ